MKLINIPASDLSYTVYMPAFRCGHIYLCLSARVSGDYINSYQPKTTDINRIKNYKIVYKWQTSK